MTLSLIAAVARNSVIGKRGAEKMLWHLPDDFKHFKALTTGKPIIMGRSTFESIGRPLPHRTNIVLTTKPDYRPDGVTIVHSADEALAAAQRTGAAEAMVIGGGEIYRLFFDRATRLYITRVDADINGDVHFPIIDPAVWQETVREPHPADDKHAYPFSFVQYDRIRAASTT